ncbi:cell wall-binding repeat-containing protein [Mobiluncus curtisii]|uniref:cell wall-binding repeat-containing protein n=1 Tax=Mobiluncus curtisii TaxID=2051 RepID=UPI0024323B02|nr:cell wall-binding repeat-containing protein [Mobiluncus curtisii]
MNLKKKFVIGAASLALVAGMGVAPAMAAAGNPVLLPGGKKLVRVAGDARVETSLEAAKLRMKQGTVSRAYLVNQNALVDAATAGMVKDGVVILVPSDKAGQLLLGATMHKDPQLKNVRTLVAVGGESVMPKAAVDNVAKMNPSITDKSERLGGENRYETNVAIAKKVFPNGGAGQKFLLARGDNMVDALTAGAYEGGPTLLVNPSGKVDSATVAYAKKAKISSDSVILGGEGVLPTAQVEQLFEGKVAIDPWKYQTTNADLKKAVQEAAAAYEGQKVWQGLNGKTQDADDNLKNFFGLDKSDYTCTDTDDVADIDVKDGITDNKKCFVGYKKSLANLKGNAKKLLDKEIKVKLDAVKTAVNDAVKNNNEAIAAGQAAPNTAAAFSKGQGSFDAINGAFKNAYGDVELTKPTLLAGELDNQGSFKFDNDGNLLDLDWKKIDQIVDNYIADMGDTEFIKVDGAPNAGVKLSDVAKTKPNDNGDAALTATGNYKVNYAAVKKAIEARVAEQVKTTADAKKALDEAVAAYKAGPADKVTVRTGSGMARLVGEDRYQTSALLSYWLREKQGFTDTFVYLASGDDAHLIDSVVAGQLQHGPILLVPTSGDLKPSTVSELTLMGKQKTLQGGYIMGGTGAVEDAVAQAAGKAIADGGKFVNAPAAPTLTAVSITMDPNNGEVTNTGADTGAKTVTLTCAKAVGDTADDVQYSWDISGASGQVQSGAADATHFGAGALNTNKLTLTSPANAVATGNITIPADKIVCKATSAKASVSAANAKSAKNTVIKYTKG